MTVDALKAAPLLFLAVIVQVSILYGVDVVGGRPDLVLVALVLVALLRGAIFGAIAGFFAGFLLDAAQLSTLGVSALVLTVVGYWIGRYGETTGRDRAHAPFLSVAVVTVLTAFGLLLLHAVLGEHVPVHAILIDSLVPSIVCNVLLTFPVYALCRRLLRPRESTERAHEVELLA